MNQNNPNSGNHKVVVIVGIVASVLTLFTFLTGITNIWDIRNINIYLFPQVSSPISITNTPYAIDLDSGSINWNGQLIYIFDGTVVSRENDRKVTPLFIAPKNSSKLRWSPDGKHIAYIRDNKGSDTAILVMDNDGTNAFTIFAPTTWGVAIHDISWLSDSKNILFSFGQYQSKLGIVNIDSLSVQEFDFCSNYSEGRVRQIMLSPDDAKIAYLDFNGDLGVRAINDSECEIWLDELFGHGPFIFSSENLDEIIYYNSGNLYRVSKPGSGETRLVLIDELSASEGDLLSYMSWHPSGRYLAINSSSSLYVLDNLTGKVERVFHDSNFNGFEGHTLHWLP